MTESSETTAAASQVRGLASDVTPFTGSPAPGRIPSGAHAPGGRARQPDLRASVTAERADSKRVQLNSLEQVRVACKGAENVEIPFRPLIYRRGDLLPKDRHPVGWAPLERPLATLTRDSYMT